MAVPVNITFHLLLISLILILIAYLFAVRKFNYWRKRGIAYVRPVPFFGNLKDLFLLRRGLGEICKEVYDSTAEPVAGMFVCDEPFLVVRDPHLVKLVLVKDFASFYDRTLAENKRDDPMGSHMLFVIRNPEWKELRRKITPVFTSGKMRLMCGLVARCGRDMQTYLRGRVGASGGDVETREVCAKFTTEAITSAAFGIDANCFREEDAEFRVVSRRIFNWTSFSRGVETMSYFISPLLVKLFRMKFIDGASSAFLRRVFWQAMQRREQAKFVRNDLLDILIEMRKAEHAGNDDTCKLEGDRLVAQATQFFVAGYETSSTTISFTLYELARNPDVQDRLRQEIVEMKRKHGSFTYDALKDMEYLDWCVKETLRKYPLLPFLDRRCNADYQLPDSDVIIEKGTGVYIPVLGLHYDPQYFPDPDKYAPERFAPENIDSRPPICFLGFGEGPRNCIGARFGTLSTKTGLVHILEDFQVEPCAKTPKVMKFDPKGFILAPTNGLWLRFQRVH